MTAALSHLFRPLAIGPVELANRIVSTAHQTGLVEDSLPTADFVAYHEARARGGAGLIVVEATAVHETGRLTSHTIAGYDERIVPAWRVLGDAIRPHRSRVFAQLFHGGRELISTAPRPPAVAPSALPSPRFHVEPRALSATEIESIVAGYARSAELAAAGGLDGVEISAAHNYLIAQFFTPELNHRTDRWGEPLAFVTAVLEAVRRAAPRLVVGIRFSADAAVAPAVARAVADRVDYVSVALGDSATHRGSRFIVPPPPTTANAVLGRAAPFRAGPVLVATSRITDPAAADRLIADGVIDAAGMTRALITDPDLPRKAATGRLADLVRCLGCNACIAHYHAGTPIACAQNPRTGRERTLPVPSPTPPRRRIVVVGAGPAGLAAAVEAAAAGQEVMLLEREPAIGGQVALLAGTVAHGELAARLVGNYLTQLAAAKVELRFGETADVGLVAGLAPDAVVVATGARPYEGLAPRTGVPVGGHELVSARSVLAEAPEEVEVLDGWQVLAGRRPVARTTLIVDWGGDSTGLDCAELLQAAGYEVVLAVADVLAGSMVHQYARNAYLERLYTAGVRIEHHVVPVGTGPGGVRCRNLFAPAIERVLPAGAAVLCLGRVPEDALLGELRAALPAVAVDAAGDCLGPRSVEEAVLEGTLAARRVSSAAVRP